MHEVAVYVVVVFGHKPSRSRTSFPLSSKLHPVSDVSFELAYLVPVSFPHHKLKKKISLAETRLLLGSLDLRAKCQGFIAVNDVGRAGCASASRGKASGGEDGDKKGGSGAHLG